MPPVQSVALPFQAAQRPKPAEVTVHPGFTRMGR